MSDLEKKRTIERIKRRAHVDAMFEYRQNLKYDLMDDCKTPSIGSCIKALAKIGVQIDPLSTDPSQRTIDALDAYRSEFRYFYRCIASNLHNS